MKRIKGYCNVYSDDSHLSIRRIACGNKRFYYRYASGKKVTGERVLKRIKKLVIPPNWRDTFNLSAWLPLVMHFLSFVSTVFH